MVEWLALRAGSRLLLMPKAEAMELAPKQSAEADNPLASRSEGFLFVTEIALVKLRSGGLELRQRDDRRAPDACAACHTGGLSFRSKSFIQSLLRLPAALPPAFSAAAAAGSAWALLGCGRSDWGCAPQRFSASSCLPKRAARTPSRRRRVGNWRGGPSGPGLAVSGVSPFVPG